MSISGNVIIQPTYKIKADYIKTNTGYLYIGSNMNPTSIKVGNTNAYVATSDDITTIINIIDNKKV